MDGLNDVLPVLHAGHSLHGNGYIPDHLKTTEKYMGPNEKAKRIPGVRRGTSNAQLEGRSIREDLNWKFNLPGDGPLHRAGLLHGHDPLHGHGHVADLRRRRHAHMHGRRLYGGGQGHFKKEASTPAWTKQGEFAHPRDGGHCLPMW